ncbi:MAG: methionyl-tRNA formyltransferase [Candidatus Doudnabacteria bacterium RIFCSPLOWO2_01_FULL_44_21]|uniref:Methionyl-tRNA formyltransferase n=1 Tax=Candidatus Doudnabacteria bacterium RIFCSPLOWO2_01_FULL_44_21 TaxID=1817841 RepID=A0A1F5Q5A2_9BACT|nr:MAG: methionyl-tRNA formyltransferase [Candidatus Doudnabacteria bacterium RIFCSPHIGHO2_02_FULL_43_13b]OGE97349.1 MAG: methionyl-tRNA formyltransferase [Candidatus Doudnabacteria bacterium RIFCSPLOWO2_01_FULL_44_21]
MPKKIIFVGTTEFGIPTLEKLMKDYELVLIITQPDKPAGRDKKLTPPPIKTWAEKNNIKVLQPQKILDSKLQILDPQPDLMIVAAYGQIIPKEILDLPKFGSINIHGSILPKYRGASPIQAAIANGDAETGITLIQMDEKMDHGPLIAAKTININSNDNYMTLHKKLSDTAADLVAETLPKWVSGEIKPYEQNHEKATFVHLLSKNDSKINWSRPSIEIDRQIRAFNPEPGTWTTLANKHLKILAAEIIADHKIELPGKLYVANGELAVKCLDSGLLLKKVKPEGKNEMTGKDFLNGLKNLNNKIFI